jgi:hypothetical protein
MNQELGLRVLSGILDWNDDQARKEFEWLRLMARLKYDGYRDFQAGMRFIESLATWLQQFSKQERQVAYEFVRTTLVYIGPSEMQRLVEQFYPRFVRDRLTRTVAASRGIPAFRILADAAAAAAVTRLSRQTLFMGLSDGARIDIVRHANVGLLTNEQLVTSTQIDKDKWQDLRKKLRDDLEDDTAKFAVVYLLDDFMGTGTSLLRYDEEKKKWKGKLTRFKDSLAAAIDELGEGGLLEQNWQLCVHHYVGTAAARSAIEARAEQAREFLDCQAWAQSVHFSFGTVLPEEMPIDRIPDKYAAFIALTRRYYDPILRTIHTDVGKVSHLGLGYGGCGLPLVLDHNTPNNSVALLWAETEGGQRADGVVAPAMRPLFRRRQRHA